ADASLKKRGLFEYRRPDFPETEIFEMPPGRIFNGLPHRGFRRQNVFKTPDKLYHFYPQIHRTGQTRTVKKDWRSGWKLL
ncbi:MAG: hypothetical protein ACOC1H_04210, partial [Desulfosalsimonas sp.]